MLQGVVQMSACTTWLLEPRASTASEILHVTFAGAAIRVARLAGRGASPLEFDDLLSVDFELSRHHATAHLATHTAPTVAPPAS